MMMQTVRAPLSHPVDIAELKPTQMTIGLREVQTRATKIKALAAQDANKLVRKHVIPVVKGPKEKYYVIDHHHLCRAMLLAGQEQVSVMVVLNLVRLEKDAFWVFMDNRGLVHPFDDQGKRCAYRDIPKTIGIWPTIRSGAWPGHCAARAAMPRTPRPSANSSGPISCAAASTARTWTKTSTPLSKPPWRSPKRPMPITSPAGAARWRRRGRHASIHTAPSEMLSSPQGLRRLIPAQAGIHFPWAGDRM